MNDSLRDQLRKLNVRVERDERKSISSRGAIMLIVAVIAWCALIWFVGGA